MTLKLILCTISVLVVASVCIILFSQAVKQREKESFIINSILTDTTLYDAQQTKEGDVSLERMKNDILKVDEKIMSLERSYENVKSEYDTRIDDLGVNVTNMNQHVSKTLNTVNQLSDKQTEKIAKIGDTVQGNSTSITSLNDQVAVINGKLVNISQTNALVQKMVTEAETIRTDQGELRDYVSRVASKSASDVSDQNATIANLQNTTTERITKQNEEIQKAFNVAKSVQNLVTTLDDAIANVRMKFSDYYTKTDTSTRFASKEDLSTVNKTFGNYMTTADFNVFKSGLPDFPTRGEMEVIMNSFLTSKDLVQLQSTLTNAIGSIAEINLAIESMKSQYVTNDKIAAITGEINTGSVNIQGLYLTLQGLQGGLDTLQAGLADTTKALNSFKDVNAPATYATKADLQAKFDSLNTIIGSLQNNTASVLNTLVVNSSFTATGTALINDVAISKNYSSYPDTVGKLDRAEIANDLNTYKKLMLVGNKVGGTGKREVGVWDNLSVNGNLSSIGKVSGVNLEATTDLTVGTNTNTNNNAFIKSDGSGYIPGKFGVGVLPTDATNFGTRQFVARGGTTTDWQAQFINPNGNRSVYMNHGSGNGLQINTNNTEGTKYAIQATNSTTGNKTFEVLNDGKVNAYGDFTLSSGKKFIGDGSSITNLNSANLNGTIGVDKGGTGITTPIAAKLLVGGTSSWQQPADLHWDTTNKRLGIGLGTNLPSSTLDIAGDVKALSSYCLNDVCFNNTEWNLLKAQIATAAKLSPITINGSYTINVYTTGANQQRKFSTLPSTNQNLLLYYVSNTTGATINPDYTVNFLSRGSTSTWNISLSASFASAIMKENNLTAKAITIAVTEKLLTALTILSSFSQSIFSNAVGQNFSFTNLPANDQGLPVTYSVATNDASGMTPSISGTTVNYKALGVTGTKTISLLVGFSQAIMTETGLTAKSISLVVNETAQLQLYTFTSHKFTNAGAIGRLGPNLSQCRTAYSAASWAQNSAYFNMTTQGIQLWTVPQTGQYRFEVAGAMSGNVSNIPAPGYGRKISGVYSLTSGNVVSIIVGQMGLVGWNWNDRTCNSGGGGGSFVFVNNTLLFAAGGGGGPNGWRNGNGGNANFSGGGAGGYSGGGAGGSNGGPGTGGGPAAWGGAGQAGSNGSGGNGGTSDGGGGGGGGTGDTNATYEGGAAQAPNGGAGGFGGGGSSAGGGSVSAGGGGGGGYSGGGGGSGGSTSSDGGGGGGGGGSYYIGVGTDLGTNADHGYVTITAI